MIYQPEEDSYLLAKIVKEKAKGKRVLDVGSGSGVQALAALDGGAEEVLCAEIDNESFKFLKKQKLNVVKSNLFSKVVGEFDLIIFNPPYLPKDEREDSESARITSGGKRGDEITIKFLRDVEKFLSEEGKILLLISSLTPDERIEKILSTKKFEKKVVAREKIFMEQLEVWELSRKA